MPVTLVMLEAIRDHYLATGIRIGMKPAGGIRTAKQALHYLVMVKETLDDHWLSPNLFRFRRIDTGQRHPAPDRQASFDRQIRREPMTSRKPDHAPWRVIR